MPMLNVVVTGGLLNHCILLQAIGRYVVVFPLAILLGPVEDESRGGFRGFEGSKDRWSIFFDDPDLVPRSGFPVNIDALKDAFIGNPGRVSAVPGSLLPVAHLRTLPEVIAYHAPQA